MMRFTSLEEAGKYVRELKGDNPIDISGWRVFRYRNGEILISENGTPDDDKETPIWLGFVYEKLCQGNTQ